MNRLRQRLIATALVAALPHAALAFDSGSTGADGAFNPTVNTALDLPPDGIFNFTSVNIPQDVTVTFRKNITNTPVVILATGDVTVAGTIDVSGGRSAPVGAAGDGNIGDDGQPGAAGPGGFDGGRGGQVEDRTAGSGLGPGSGNGGRYVPFPGCSSSYYASYGGGGGGFGAAGNESIWSGDCRTDGGRTYGSSVLLPLIGGSGGGGGAGGSSFAGSGGGGGGGAILIASSGTVNVTGAIRANGGASGDSAGQNTGATGGGGSGGGMRIVADTISGNGAISAAGGARGTATYSGAGARAANGGAGAIGRIRFEANTITRTAASTPAASVGTPGPVFIAGMPSLAITSVAGVDAPTSPSGSADITLPTDTPNPVTITFRTQGVPVGNIVALTVTPAYGDPVTVHSPALTGSTEEATASISVDLPVGPSTLQARTTYTVIAAVGDVLGNMYAGGERVEGIELVATLGGAPSARLITVSGTVVEAPIEALRIAAAGA